jgi:hypothetical protein
MSRKATPQELLDVEIVWKRVREFTSKEKFTVITAKARPAPPITPKFPVCFDYINILS